MHLGFSFSELICQIVTQLCCMYCVHTFQDQHKSIQGSSTLVCNQVWWNMIWVLYLLLSHSLHVCTFVCVCVWLGYARRKIFYYVRMCSVYILPTWTISPVTELHTCGNILYCVTIHRYCICPSMMMYVCVCNSVWTRDYHSMLSWRGGIVSYMCVRVTSVICCACLR